jgi:CheY-like chemotaxis protein
MKKRGPDARDNDKEERPTSSTVTYSSADIEEIKKAYETKLVALESKIQMIKQSIVPKSPEGPNLHTPLPHSLFSSLERSTPTQLFELFESSLKKGSKRPDFRTLSFAWGVLFSSLFLSSTEVQSEIHKISRENQAMLREVVKTDCARGGRFVFDVIKKGGNIDRSALIMIANLQNLAGIGQEGVPAIHLLTRACDKNIRPVLIEKAGIQLLSSEFDSNGLPILFSLLSMGNLSIQDIDAIEKVFSKDDLRRVMAQNRMGRTGLEAFTEISTQIRENLALQHKTFTENLPQATATGEGVAGPTKTLPVTDKNSNVIPVDKEIGCPAEPGDDSKSAVCQLDASSMPNSGDATNKDIKILIADDSEIIRRLLHQRLKDLGYKNCVQVNSGDDAVRVAGEVKPDIIFMDIIMPGKLDGIDAAREIKAHVDTQIIFLTSCSNKETLDRAKRVDPDGYILKPFTATNIRVALKLLE